MTWPGDEPQGAARGRTRDVRHCDGPRKPDDGGRAARRPLVDEQLADQLLVKAAAEGVELLGPDGLLSQVTKAVLERALAGEMTGHLGYDKHDPAGRAAATTATAAQPWPTSCIPSQPLLRCTKFPLRELVAQLA